MRHALFALLALAACDPSRATPADARAGRLTIVPAPAGDEPVGTIVKREREAAAGRTVLVYVGAPWCEPCTHFHDAAARGELDAELPGLTLIEFDRDRDEKRLGDARCLSRLIPLFAVPDADGDCSDRQVTGSIKGPGAVANLTPRVKALLAQQNR